MMVTKEHMTLSATVAAIAAMGSYPRHAFIDGQQVNAPLGSSRYGEGGPLKEIDQRKPKCRNRPPGWKRRQRAAARRAGN